MTTAAVQAVPAVPPRPSRKSDSPTGSVPKIPPRPSKKNIERAVSPNPERFAPSPFHDGEFTKNQPALLSPTYGIHEPVEDPIERAGSVPLPSVGEEGVEYSAVADEVERETEEQEKLQAASPEHTRTVAHDLKLHAPKPSLPADSAKQRVQVVTRTDSDRAASFGIGRAASRDGVKKKPSTSFSTSSDNGTVEDEQGIPEIGQRVPMNPHLGDVQAPSFPDTDAPRKGHHRKTSSRGLPPGSYGLHGHGVGPQDKLQKAYYEKNPEALKKDEYTPIHDPQHNFAMSSAELNKLVRETASHGAGVGTTGEYRSTPTDEVGFQASEEYANRIATPRPVSRANGKSGSSTSSRPEIVLPEGSKDADDGAIHVDDPSHPEYRSFGDDENAIEDRDDYQAPILAADELASDSRGYLQRPAVLPPPERKGSAFEMDDAPSRPTSRPVSMHKDSQPEIRTTPLDDVEEYEPLFPEGAKDECKKMAQADDTKTHRPFPSKDVWEDAPSSVHYTTTVSTPDVPEPEHHRSRSSGTRQDRPLTPAHAFALKQEELAEKEAEGGRAKGISPTYLPVSSDGKHQTWAARQPHLKPERPSVGHRFPSRDVWEDVPDSHVYETTIESPHDESKPEEPELEESKPEDSQAEESSPAVPARPSRKSPDSSERPAIPSRPKPKQTPSDERQRPAVSEKPKPQIPVRPSKSLSGDSKDGEAPKAKPPVPSRPVGGKIAALQAGFMSDLNKRLQLGPQAPKKEETPAPDASEAAEEKEKVPLSDARKGRARGPQRRAPAKSPVPAASVATEAKTAAPTLSISSSIGVWSISPDIGHVQVEDAKAEKAGSTSSSEKTAAETVVKPEVRFEDVSAPKSEPEPVSQDEVKDEGNEKSEKDIEAEKVDSTEIETKTLAANTAGESILETTVEKKVGGDEVEPLTVEEEVKS